MIYGSYLKFVGGGGGTAISTAKLMKTGQTTSYRTGDDGDLQEGRYADFFTLAENNPFGNTNRFTDLEGGQTYTDGVVVDWSTFNGTNVLCVLKTFVDTGLDWNGTLDYILATTFSGKTGWRMVNVREVHNLFNYENDLVLNYSPFNFNASYFFWTSTSWKTNSLLAFAVFANYGAIDATAKTQTFRSLAVRNFTLTELGL